MKKTSIQPKLIINKYTASLYNDIMIVGSGFEITTKKKQPRILDNFDSFSLHLVVSGSGYYTIHGKTHTVTKGQIFCIFPNEPIKYVPSNNNPWTYYWINFTGSKALTLLNRLNLTVESPIIVTSNPSIKRAFVRTVLECEEHPETSDLIALSNFYRITSLLQISQNISNNNSNSSSLVDDTITFINRHYRNPELTIAIVAKNLSVSPAHLSRLFKKQTGMTFTTMLTSIRLKVALHLMNNGVSSISDISEAVGYNDPYYFSKIFTKKSNSTPSDYIKKIQQKTKK